LEFSAVFSLRRLLCASLACATLGVCAFGGADAHASRGQAVFFEGSTDLLNPLTREHALAQLQYLGVRALRVELEWYSVAPAPKSAQRPSFDATNPGNYNWFAYDWIVQRAAEHHWQVLLTVTAPVPKWATSSHRDYLTRPDSQDFQQFMTAVGRHFGSKISLFSIWNEPNHPDFLAPQFNSNGTPASPRIYRGLFQAGYAGLQAAGLSQPRVLMGETAPTGFVSAKGRHPVAPLVFLRGVLCLDSHYRRMGACGALPAYGYAHHAYTKASGPSYVPPGRDDVTIGVLSRLTRALDLAARAHAIRAHMPVYLTEFGIQSKPNRYLGVSVSKQAEYDAIAERIAWANPRVVAFSQYLLRDDPLGGRPGSAVIGFQTGLEYVSGRPKPLYFSWPLPLVVRKLGGGVSLWGLVRPAGAVTTVTVLVQSRSARAFHVLAKVRTDSHGYWSLRSHSASAWRVRWGSYQGPSIHAS
jgi:hypothetical protein